jgi:hypothetical protein
MAASGRIGLAAFQSRNWFDNLTVCRGWQEDDEAINGWSGGWPVASQGMASPGSGQQIAVKGDPMQAQEISAYSDTGSLPLTGRAGIIIAHIDDNNYLCAAVNYASRQLELFIQEGGSEHLLAAVPIRRESIYGYSNFEGVSQTNYIFDLRGEAAVSGTRTLWLYGPNNHLNIDYKLPNTGLSSFGYDVWDGANWQDRTVNYVWGGRGRFHDAPFTEEQQTTRVRLRVPSGINRPFAFAVCEDIASQNFIRAVRQWGRIYVWVNNKLLIDCSDPYTGEWTRAGLFSENCSTVFDSITCFEIPAVIPADFTHDNRVDLDDFSLLSQVWMLDYLSLQYDELFDISDPADGIIDINDLKVFAEQWLIGK